MPGFLMIGWFTRFILLAGEIAVQATSSVRLSAPIRQASRAGLCLVRAQPATSSTVHSLATRPARCALNPRILCANRPFLHACKLLTFNILQSACTAACSNISYIVCFPCTFCNRACSLQHLELRCHDMLGCWHADACRAAGQCSRIPQRPAFCSASSLATVPAAQVPAARCIATRARASPPTAASSTTPPQRGCAVPSLCWHHRDPQIRSIGAHIKVTPACVELYLPYQCSLPVLSGRNPAEQLHQQQHPSQRVQRQQGQAGGGNLPPELAPGRAPSPVPRDCPVHAQVLSGSLADRLHIACRSSLGASSTAVPSRAQPSTRTRRAASTTRMRQANEPAKACAQRLDATKPRSLCA